MTIQFDLSGKVAIVTGGGKGIGRAIALGLSSAGARVVVAGRTADPLNEVAEQIRAAGGQALPLPTDLTDGSQIDQLAAKTIETFGRIDILVNNASAIFLARTLDTPLKRFDLMHQINTRGTFACSQACIPHLKKAANPHILNLSPPLNMDANWFAPA